MSTMNTDRCGRALVLSAGLHLLVFALLWGPIVWNSDTRDGVPSPVSDETGDVRELVVASARAGGSEAHGFAVVVLPHAPAAETASTESASREPIDVPIEETNHDEASEADPGPEGAADLELAVSPSPIAEATNAEPSPEEPVDPADGVPDLAGGGGSEPLAPNEDALPADATTAGTAVSAAEFERLGRVMNHRLAAEGGKAGRLQFTLAWGNRNDLDLHVVPPSGESDRVYFGRPRAAGGELDVDENVAPETDEPVENVVWIDEPPPGEYVVVVDHFNVHTETDATEFVLRVTRDGAVRQFTGHVEHGDPAARSRTVCRISVE